VVNSLNVHDKTT